MIAKDAEIRAKCFALLVKNRRDTDPLESLIGHAVTISEWAGTDPLKVLAISLIGDLRFHASTGGFYLQQCCEQVYTFLKGEIPGEATDAENPTQDATTDPIEDSANETQPKGVSEAEDEEESGGPRIAKETRTPRRRGPNKPK
jgi:hypothetical protein